jgi:hypothetical protein
MGVGVSAAVSEQTEQTEQSEIVFVSDEMITESKEQEPLSVPAESTEFNSFEEISQVIKEFYINEVKCFYDVILLIHNLNHVKNQTQLKKKLHTFLDTYYYKSNDYSFFDYRELFDYNLVNVMLLSDMCECENIRSYLSDIREFSSNLFDINSIEGEVDMTLYDDIKDEVSIFAQKRLMGFITESEDQEIDENLEIAVRSYVMW